MAVWNGHVTQVGKDRDLLALRARDVRTIDLRKQVVIPGLSDSHVHLLGYGAFLRTLNLTGKRSIQQIHQSVAKAVKRTPEGSWVTGRGWDQEKLRERRFLDRHDLSGFSSNPVFLRRICGHVAVGNDVALSLAGIGRDTPDPKGGEIVRDPASGEATGLLKENAIGLVEGALPKDEASARDAILYAARRLVRLGLTSLHCIVDDSMELKLLHQLKNEGKIVQSIYAILPLDLLDESVDMGLVADRNGSGFRAGGFKVYVDGSLGARTAALSAPYEDDPSNHGMLRMDSGQLEDVIEKASSSGFQVCAHAIGDRAVEAAVSAFEKTGLSRLRHRIEHASLIPPKLIRRMKRARLVASVQPRFLYSDSWATDRLGQPRIPYLYPFHSMLRIGVPTAFGSDCPADDPNPFEGVWSAVTRPGSAADEGLSVAEAISCYTSGAAFASFSEQATGALDPGKRADMVFLDRDPFRCDIEELRKTRVTGTMVKGIVSS